MKREITRAERRYLEAENKKWPEHLIEVSPDAWPHKQMVNFKQPFNVWRSRYFLVQGFPEQNFIVRLSVCRTSHNGDSWDENITWDELQEIKAQCGYGNADAVEIYPPTEDVVNVANMRHLWVLPDKLDFPWRKKP